MGDEMVHPLIRKIEEGNRKVKEGGSSLPSVDILVDALTCRLMGHELNYSIEVGVGVCNRCQTEIYIYAGGTP